MQWQCNVNTLFYVIHNFCRTLVISGAHNIRFINRYVQAVLVGGMFQVAVTETCFRGARRNTVVTTLWNVAVPALRQLQTAGDIAASVAAVFVGFFWNI